MGDLRHVASDLEENPTNSEEMGDLRYATPNREDNPPNSEEMGDLRRATSEQEDNPPNSEEMGDLRRATSEQEDNPPNSEDMGDAKHVISDRETNPASDLSSALEILGVKYDGLMKNYQDQSSELEDLGNQCEVLRKKCLEECKPNYDALMKKYNQECSERKRLYNEIVELKGNIRVFCRCRPLSPDDLSKGVSSVVEFDQLQDTELQIICSDTSRKQFKFDHVFGFQDNQEAVFEETLPIIKSVLDGYNACIFAYGQTGTGKTFTMEGTEEDRGVNFRALEELFKISQERKSTIKYEFFVSMLEVYNEKIRDLLADNSNQQGKKLEVKQAADGTQEVPGLVEAQTYVIDEVWNLLKTGQQNRSVGSTNANELSSRSHCLVRVTVKEENQVTGQRSRSNLWLVDLAGSERVGKIEVEGERLKESQFINKSLSALGDVISALASKNPHIPYRNSKLTHLLQSSLGGDCKTLMFVQISPSSTDLGETLCSLNFATRVRGIEQGPVRKQPDAVESFKYKQLAERLRQEEKETARLNESLQLMHLKYASRENVFKSLQEKVRDLESQLADARKTRHLQETRDSASKSFRPPLHPIVNLRETRDSASKSHRPPLHPIALRPPLSRMSNNYLPRSGPRRSSTLLDKENFSMGKKSAAHVIPPKPPVKARRVSLHLQPKRRASVAALPSQAHVQRDSTTQFPISRIPRKSLATPSMIMRTPDTKGKMGSFGSSSRFYSPLQMQQSGSKLCFSIQKRVPVRPIFLGADLREKEVVGKVGAQRILCKNRRQSVI